MAEHSVEVEQLPNGTGSRHSRLISFLLILGELLLIACVAFEFEIESQQHFFPVLCVMIVGFVIQFWMPTCWRMPFFATLSVATSWFVLGLVNGAWMFGLAAVLIGICQHTTSHRIRVGLLIVVAAGMCFFRWRTPMPFWPVVGSMFMFRLIVYVYERRKATGRRPLSETVAYFFLLPNVCFPLFPIVDHSTFRKSWFAEDEIDTYQRGVAWILRGFTHLLLYRFIRQEIVPEPYELSSIPRLALFMASNYALYLQVSGQFHLVTGLLHLFGFRLPETHHLYFLATSCSDIWRRINIYWKDFLTKLFFFPTFHAARRRGLRTGPSVVAGVLCVFIATWLLHSWQTFWLLGHFPVTAHDAALWLGAGSLVALNLLWERPAGTSAAVPAWRHAFAVSVRIVAMFSAVSLFWACWTYPGFLRLVWGIARRPGAATGLLVVGSWMIAAVVILTAIRLALSLKTIQGKTSPAATFRESVQWHVIGLGLLIALTRPEFDVLLGQRIAGIVDTFRTSASNQKDGAAGVRSYYEDLNSTVVQAGPMMRALSPGDETRRQQAFGFRRVSRDADLAQGTELIPGISIELEGKPFTTNAFGMRDRPSLNLIKPAGTRRIAVVGSSIVMGYGVADDRVFTRIFEDLLNGQSERTERYEVLNFGVGSQWAPQRLVRIQRMVFAFEPDAVFYIAHQDEFTGIAEQPAALLAAGLPLPSERITRAVEQTGVSASMPPGGMLARLHRHEEELLEAVYATIVDECREHSAIPVYIYLPIFATAQTDIGDRVLPLARRAGFVVCDLSDWAAGHTPEDAYSPGDDVHPDERGHRLIGEALLQMVETHPEALPSDASNGEQP